MMLVVQYEEGAERPPSPDGWSHLDEGLVLADQPVVALLRFRQFQVWYI